MTENKKQHSSAAALPLRDDRDEKPYTVSIKAPQPSDACHAILEDPAMVPELVGKPTSQTGNKKLSGKLKATVFIVINGSHKDEDVTQCRYEGLTIARLKIRSAFGGN